MKLRHSMVWQMRFCLISLFLSSVSLDVRSQARPWGQWTVYGEQPDGSYCNPIIPSDYSDIDCIRVGDDYYAISSTMQFSPGMTMLHSTDLVNWEICGNVISDITQIGPELNWDRMNRYGRGVWAGTLRYHAGRFYLFFGTPDEGLFMTSAESPQGPWQPLVTLIDEPGWDDCSALWDDDGKACFVATNFSDGYKTYLFEMTPDGKKVNGRMQVNSGSGREASKLIKHGGWYYLIFSESRNGRYVLAKRSRNLFGPYDEERKLTLPNKEAMEPNQGGLIEGKDGKWYFLTHHGRGDWSGRIVSLLPVTWIDGWPIIGGTRNGEPGGMVWCGAMPAADNTTGRLALQRSDDFSQAILSPQWQWNYQPRADMWSLTERHGWLRLKAFRPLRANNLKYAGNMLTQRCFRVPHNDVVVKMDISHMADGQRSGFCHFSIQHSAIGVVREEGQCFMEYRQNDSIVRGEEITSSHVWLRSVWGLDGISRFYYSVNEKDYREFGAPFQLKWGHYRGSRLGIYCFNDKTESGYVDVDYFCYDM